MSAPVLFLILFAAIELSHANMVFNGTEAAAYEGARTDIVPGATAADCETAAQRVLDIAGIKEADISITPTDLSVSTANVVVPISVPYDRNTITSSPFTHSLIIRRDCVLTRERL